MSGMSGFGDFRVSYNATNSGYENKVVVWENHVFSRGVWRLCEDFDRMSKIGGMSGDTYLFRRSPSIDRLGPDLSKSGRFLHFKIGWSRWIEGDPSIHRL